MKNFKDIQAEKSPERRARIEARVQAAEKDMKNFKELQDKMSPEAQAKSEALAEADLAQMNQQHHYVSTACQHGLHGQCRERCKFCDAKCQCTQCSHSV